jgi:hypothetical protein
MNTKLILFIILIFLLVYIIIYKQYEKYEKRKKYAICLWGELRGVESTHASFNEFLVKPLDADVYVLVQRTSEESDKILDMFDEPHVKYKRLYDKPTVEEYFSSKFSDYKHIDGNWKWDSNIQQYINFNEMAKTFGDKLQEYDYIIMIRSDFLFLFDFPDILSLTNETSDKFWCYDGHSYSGINYTMMTVPSTVIMKYLTSPYNYIMNGNVHEMSTYGDPNCERFLGFIFKKENWNLGYIENNAFLSANSTNERTNTASIKYDEKRNVHYKYSEQLENSYNAMESWKINRTWVLNGNKIEVKK